MIQTCRTSGASCHWRLLSLCRRVLRQQSGNQQNSSLCSVGLFVQDIASDFFLFCAHTGNNILAPNYKNIFDFLQGYLKLDHKSSESSRLTGTLPCDLTYDYGNLITKNNLRT